MSGLYNPTQDLFLSGLPEFENPGFDPTEGPPVERKSFIERIPKSEILKDVCAYVEAWKSDGTQNFSNVFEQVLARMGARVEKRFLHSSPLTHLIFKDGRTIYLEKAKAKKLRIISSEWVEKCRTTQTYVEEFDYLFDDTNYIPPKRHVDKTLVPVEVRLKRRADRERRAEMRRKKQEEKRYRRIDEILAPLVAQSPEFGRRGDKIDYSEIRRKMELNTFHITKESIEKDREAFKKKLFFQNQSLMASSDSDSDSSSCSKIEKDLPLSISSVAEVDEKETTKGRPKRSCRSLTKSNIPLDDETDEPSSSKKMKTFPRFLQNSDEDQTSNDDEEKESQTSKDFDINQNILESSNEVCNSSLRDFQRSPVLTTVPMVYIVGIYGKKKKEMGEKIIKLGGRVTVDYDDNQFLTHMVVGGRVRKQICLYHATARGLWMISPKWVEDSWAKSTLLDPESYELKERFSTAYKNRQIKMKEPRQRRRSWASDLFAGLKGPIFISSSVKPQRRTLEELVEYCGGKVTWYASDGIYHITGKPDEEKDHPCVDKQWLFDCVMKGKILPLDEYFHKRNEV